MHKLRTKGIRVTPWSVAQMRNVCDNANMKTSDCRTPLLAVLRQLENDERRQEFAALAGTTSNYLYQLGSCQRTSCRASKAKAIADASVQMSVMYGSDVLTVDTIATMCAV